MLGAVVGAGAVICVGVGTAVVTATCTGPRVLETSPARTKSNAPMYERPSDRPSRPNGPAGRPRPRYMKLPMDQNVKPTVVVHEMSSRPYGPKMKLSPETITPKETTNE